jgi:hypothetical protein
MAEHKVVASKAQIEEALERAKLGAREPLARSVQYIANLNLLIVGLTNGRRLMVPIEDIQGLVEGSPAQLQNHELLGGGTGISFPEIDVDLYVPALIDGVYGNRRWMAQLGKKGGTSKSDAKRRTARTNGAKGGRPKKQVDAFRRTSETAAKTS